MYINTMIIKDNKDRKIILEVLRKMMLEKYRLFKNYSRPTPFLIREPDEITLSIKQEQDFIRTKKNSENELLLIAEIGGKHIGNCSLMSIGGYKRYRHRCDIAIALYKEYCGVGIGKAMLETVLDIAEKVGYE